MKDVVLLDVADIEVSNDLGHFNSKINTGINTHKTPASVKVELMAHLKDGGLRRLQTRAVDLGGLTFGTTRASYLSMREDGTFVVKKDINIGIVTEIQDNTLFVILDTDEDNDAVAYTITRLQIVK